jgi:hypothetical protein
MYGMTCIRALRYIYLYLFCVYRSLKGMAQQMSICARLELEILRAANHQCSRTCRIQISCIDDGMGAGREAGDIAP